MGGDQQLSWQKKPAKAPTAAISTAIPPMTPPGSPKRPSVSPCSVTTPRLTRTRALQMVVTPVPRYRDEDKEAADGRVNGWRRPVIGGMCDSGTGQYYGRRDSRLSPTRGALVPGGSTLRQATGKRNVTEICYSRRARSPAAARTTLQRYEDRRSGKGERWPWSAGTWIAVASLAG